MAAMYHFGNIMVSVPSSGGVRPGSSLVKSVSKYDTSVSLLISGLKGAET